MFILHDPGMTIKYLQTACINMGIIHLYIDEFYKGTVKPHVEATASAQVRLSVCLIGTERSQGAAYRRLFLGILQY